MWVVLALSVMANVMGLLLSIASLHALRESRIMVIKEWYVGSVCWVITVACFVVSWVLARSNAAALID
jgi:hypothetical protein